MKKIQLKLAWRNDLSREQWFKTPEYRDVEAIQLSSVWAVHREYGLDFWTLTHIPTGFWAARGFETMKQARKAAAALTAKYGREAWEFTDSERAVQFTEAKSIIRECGGW